MDLGIKGRRAIVTGGSSGIGFETARQFLEEGVRVLITGRNEKKLNAARDEFARRTGGEVYAVVADMTEESDIARMVETAKEKPGGVNILVNNAGQMYSGRFAVIDDKEFQNRLDNKRVACHGRACPGHPRLSFRGEDVDARHKAGHDGG
jgi:3-oxoacyl-[acyl-carrier protein] reductase